MKSYILLFYIINLTLVLCLGDSDCEHLSSFLKKYGHDMKEDCCNEPGIECENNYIKSIDLTLKPGKIDFSNFPNIENLEKLSIKGDVFGGILPLNKLHNAKILDFSHSSIKEVEVGNDKGSFLFDKIDELNLSDNLLETFPYEVNSYSLESLILDNNKITGPIDSNKAISKKISLKNNNYTGEFIVPNNVQSLNIENNFISSIKMENLKSNKLKELIASNNKFDDDVFKQLENFENLEKLILSENKNISNVTEYIGKLSELKYLDLSKNNIKDLHSNIFILTELEDFNISENPNLNIKIINFAGFEAIRNCNFNNTSISCYQPNTCSNIFKDYKTCSDEEINSIKSSQTLKPKSFLRLLTKIIISVILIIILVVICFIVVCCCCLKKCCFGHSKKNKKNKKIIHSSPMYSDNSKMDNNDNNLRIISNSVDNFNNNNNNKNNNNNSNNNNNNNYNNNHNNNANNNNNLSQNPNVTMTYPSIIITNSTPTAPTIEVVPNASYSESLEPSSSNTNYNNSYSYSYNYNKSFNNNNNNNNNINENNNNAINNDGLPTYEEATSHLK